MWVCLLWFFYCFRGSKWFDTIISCVPVLVQPSALGLWRMCSYGSGSGAGGMGGGGSLDCPGYVFSVAHINAEGSISSIPVDSELIQLKWMTNGHRYQDVSWPAPCLAVTDMSRNSNLPIQDLPSRISFRLSSPGGVASPMSSKMKNKVDDHRARYPCFSMFSNVSAVKPCV